jgi:hypothetical protein
LRSTRERVPNVVELGEIEVVAHDAFAVSG